MPNYDIADILLDVISDDDFIYNKLDSFATYNKKGAKLNICISESDIINIPQGDILLDDTIKWIHKPEDKDSFSIYISSRDGKMAALLNVENNWRDASFQYFNRSTERRSAVIDPLSEILFRTHILLHKGIVIHASAIEYEGKGIMFSAPSETGKTTQANLWKIYKKAKILNGDRPAVRMKDGQAFVFGTPWSGSSPDYINSCAPLSAIIMLEQAMENSIRLLSKYEAVTRLMPRSFLPYFDRKLMNMAVDNLEAVIQATPVYLLKCRPDQEAVELVYGCIK